MLAAKGDSDSPLSGPDSVPESGHEAVRRISQFRLFLDTFCQYFTRSRWSVVNPDKITQNRPNWRSSWTWSYSGLILVNTEGAKQFGSYYALDWSWSCNWFMRNSTIFVVGDRHPTQHNLFQTYNRDRLGTITLRLNQRLQYPTATPFSPYWPGVLVFSILLDPFRRIFYLKYNA